MNPIIKLCDLKKNYGSKEAVRGLNLEIRPGELFSLVGPNGAGKTSTLKMMAGLLKPTSGTIHIGGFDILKNPMNAKEFMSFVPDTPYIYEKLTPWELLRFTGKLYSMDINMIRERGREFLKFFSLEHVDNVLIEEFSHGMRQKVVLAAALLHNPKLLILDEPMVGLDPISIRSFKDFLKTKTREGMTVLFSTHTLSVAEELSDRIGILDRGQWIAVGSLSELQQKYRSKENLEQMFLKLVEKEEIRVGS